MKNLTLDEVSDFLASAVIEVTHDLGTAIVHSGTTEAGARFVLMNDLYGNSAVTVAI